MSWMDGWMDGWIDRWMDGWVDGWMDGWMDGCMCSVGMSGWTLVTMASKFIEIENRFSGQKLI